MGREKPGTSVGDILQVDENDTFKLERIFVVFRGVTSSPHFDSTMCGPGTHTDK